MTHTDVPHPIALTADAIADRLRTATGMADLLITTAQASPDQIALRSHATGLEWTCVETLNRTGAVAQTLREQGIRRGQTVALMLCNRPDFHVVDAAAMMLGAVPFSNYNTSAPEQIAFVLEDSGAEVVVAEAGFLTSLEAARESTPSIERILLIDQKSSVHGSLIADLAAASTDFDFSEAADIAPEDVLTLIYTSGTTGAPKGGYGSSAAGGGAEPGVRRRPTCCVAVNTPDTLRAGTGGRSGTRRPAPEGPGPGADRPGQRHAGPGRADQEVHAHAARVATRP